MSSSPLGSLLDSFNDFLKHFLTHLASASEGQFLSSVVTQIVEDSNFSTLSMGWQTSHSSVVRFTYSDHS